MATRDQVQALKERGMRYGEIALNLRCSEATVRRLLKPQAASTARLGRPPVTVLPDALLARATRATLNMSPNASDRVRTRGAFEVVASPALLTGTETPEEMEAIAVIRERLATGRRLPEAMIRQVRTAITPGALKTARGGKRHQLDGFAAHRKMTWLDEFGAEHPLRAMHLWTGDDMTLNFPFWYECADDTDRCAARFGKRVSRAQLLMLSDVATGFIVGFLIVAKRSDGYSQRDVMALMQRAMIAHGIPHEGTLFERGVWRGKLLETALRGVGMTPHTARLARSKPQERIFGIFQERMPGVICQLGLGWERFNLGRYQDDYRDNQQIWCQLRNGKLDPEAAGIPHISEMHRVCGLVCDHLNSHFVNGRQIKGVPEELWTAQLAEDAPPRPLTEDGQWLFARGHSETQIRQGYAYIRSKEFGPESHWWFHAPWFAGLGDHYRLTLRFDPADPTSAAIFSREDGARAKVRGYLATHWPESFASRWTPGQLDAGITDGEFIGLAELHPETPYLSRCKTREAEMLGRHAKEYAKFARIQCAILRPRGGRAALYDEAHDGRGNSRRLETGEQRAARTAAAVDGAMADAERVEAVAQPETPAPADIRTPRLASVPRLPRDTPAPESPAPEKPSLTAALFGEEF